MGRPKASADMVGLVKTAAGTSRPIRVPREIVGEVPSDCIESPAGLLVESTKKCQPVSQAFTGIAYLRRLALHRRRVRKEEQMFRELNRPGMRKPVAVKSDLYREQQRKKLKAQLPGRTWDSLRLVDCAGCKRPLMGESESDFRREVEVRGLKVLKLLPPLVAKRVQGRPLCEECVRSRDISEAELDRLIEAMRPTMPAKRYAEDEDE